ncbi:uncharacterized protein EI90DRAFT_3065096 [Cantharellus anzutake]|uniref:uncharacterized protein n=1 Tax=Cantharellus anzutake TaxID=1750568 RepID=UPI0019042255|nr:uncharacterized protein EI90DRAFT_3065096 [Cantharellus anzutake]KAF8328397.1 hypothetical protein EI90DRAFT_3065096 [Cantharellus anzutake]
MISVVRPAIYTTNTSRCSVHPYDSEADEERFFVVRNGRRYNSTSELYPLPADEEEWDRLADLHKIHKICLGGLYQASTAVDNLLADEEGEEKSILDCGTFEFYDVNQPLDHYYGKFDVVHARSCFLGITNYLHFVDQMAQCLKPGGILLIVESPLQLTVPQSLVENTIQGNGSDIRAIDNLRGLMEWHPQLEIEESFVINIPVGSWAMAETQYLGEASEFIGGLMQENVVRLAQALRIVLLQAGHHPQWVDEWLRSIIQGESLVTRRL